MIVLWMIIEQLAAFSKTWVEDTGN